MLEILSGGREPEVEGDGIRVFVVVRKRETAIYLKRWRRRWKKGKPVNVVTLYKKRSLAAGGGKGGSTQDATPRFHPRLN